jgi:hypothetical protein
LLDTPLPQAQKGTATATPNMIARFMSHLRTFGVTHRRPKASSTGKRPIGKSMGVFP